jgi:hypothetical protein
VSGVSGTSESRWASEEERTDLKLGIE